MPALLTVTFRSEGKMKDLGIVAQFKIHPVLKSRKYFTVYVFRTRRHMQAYCRKYCTHYMGSNATAVCHAFKRLTIRPGKKDRVHPEIGSMHFYVEMASPSIVVHECTHAAIFWRRQYERKDILSVGGIHDNGYCTGTEEAICLASGDMFYQMNKALHKHKVWK